MRKVTRSISNRVPDTQRSCTSHTPACLISVAIKLFNIYDHVGNNFIKTCSLNRLIPLSTSLPRFLKGFSLCCITLGMAGYLDFIHRPVFYRTQNFWNWICFLPVINGPNTISLSHPPTGERSQIQLPSTFRF